MSNLKRRRFLQSMLAVSAGALVYARPARPGPGQARIVVIGNGVGGQAFIQAMSRLCPAAQMTCIDPLVKPVDQGPVEYLRGHVAHMDFDRRELQTTDGLTLGYDALVVSPGADIRWGKIDGYTPLAAERMPHAWIGADRGATLHRRLPGLPQGATVIVYVPAGVMRYPQAVNQRISLISQYLHHAKPRSKLLVLDARETPGKRPHTVENIEWAGIGGDNDIVRVDAGTGALHSAASTYRADLVNFIPPQQAEALAQRAGLADQSGWCPVNIANGASLKVPDIYVLGDASTADEGEKSGLSAGKQALRCASHLARIVG